MTDLATAEARVEAHSASLKKELGVRDLVLTNVTVNGKRRDERINR